jgi:hypothetical protein
MTEQLMDNLTNEEHEALLLMSEHGIAAPLSLAADAVLDAYMTNCGWLDGPLEKDYRCTAAVLRAAADQVVPQRRKPMYADSWEESTWTAQQDTRAELLAIAAELEGTGTRGSR